MYHGAGRQYAMLNAIQLEERPTFFVSKMRKNLQFHTHTELRFNAMITYYSTLDSRVCRCCCRVAVVALVVVLSAEFYGPRLNALT